MIETTTKAATITSQNSNLQPADFDNLARSYIRPELAIKAGVYRVDTFAGAAMIGRQPKNGTDYAGLIFPYVWPGQEQPREVRLRRDYPDLEAQPDGTRKEKGKYLSPPGKGNLLYFAPDTPAAWLQSPDVPAVITEGEKKTLALSRFFAETGERALVVGLSGVWNWRGVIGKDTDAQGRRQDVKGVIPDVERIIWKERKVKIVFDANAATNDSVAAARRELARELQQRGAQVLIVELPADIAGVNGIDDLLTIKGPEFVAGLLTNAQPIEKGKNTSASDILVEIASRAVFFHTPDNKAYATIPVNGHRETWPVRSQAFKQWLAYQFFQQDRKTPTAQAVQDAMGAIEGRARFEGEKHEVFTRTGAHDGAIYLDLTDDLWRAVRITGEGWEVISNPPVRFRRASGMLALPEPERGGSVSELRSILNIGDDDNWSLLTAWLLACLKPTGAYPVLVLHGEQGSAKSTATRMLRSLIDPNTATLRSTPKDERDLIIAANNAWLLTFDNCSRLPEGLSNAFCRLSTGGGFATRALYADDEETIFNVQRPLLLNGIEDITTRNDLLDRSIILYLPEIHEEQRKPIDEVWSEFERIRPRILGALLDAVSQALRESSNVKLAKLPRMADFAKWATAAETQMGFAFGSFLTAYSANREEANDTVIEISPLASGLRDLMSRQDTWEGTATELLDDLAGLVSEEQRKPTTWPKNARALSNQLRRLAPNLRRIGINIVYGSRTGKARTRMLLVENFSGLQEKPGKFASASSANASVSSASLINQQLKADARRTQADANLPEADANLPEADARRTQTENFASAKIPQETKDLTVNSGLADEADANFPGLSRRGGAGAGGRAAGAEAGAQCSTESELCLTDYEPGAGAWENWQE